MIIAAYCRVSTDKPEQLDSLAHQKEFFAEFAARNGHTLYRVYADEGISGTSLEKRTQFGRLMLDAERGAFQMVVVKDVSRFARNTVDALQSIRALKAMGVNTLFLTANMDSMGDSEFILTLFMALAQEESSNLSKRVKFGKRINAEKGRVPPRVFGYDRLDNFTLAVNETEARVVRKIFSLYIHQGLGCRSISMALNHDADRTKLGAQWNARGVRRVLVNPLYCGTLINHKYEIADFLTGKQVALPASEQLFHERPEWAIVAREDYRRAQEIMASRRRQYSSGPPFRQGRYSGRHPFSTLIKCAHCGRSFTRKSYTYVNTRIYWRCVTNDQYTAERCCNDTILDEGELLEALRTYLAARIGDREAFADRVLAQLGTTEPQTARRDLEARRRRLTAKRSRYQDLFADGLLTIQELREKLTPLDAALRDLDSLPEAPPPDRDALRREITDFLDLKTITNADLRRLLDHITVTREGDVRFHLRELAGA